MRFFLLVYQYCPHEVSELTNTFLAEDGIGFAAELGGVPIDHLLVPRMIRIFRDTRCLLANGFPAFVLGMFGRRARVRLVIPFVLDKNLVWSGAGFFAGQRVMEMFLLGDRDMIHTLFGGFLESAGDTIDSVANCAMCHDDKGNN